MPIVQNVTCNFFESGESSSFLLCVIKCHFFMCVISCRKAFRILRSDVHLLFDVTCILQGPPGLPGPQGQRGIPGNVVG